MQPMEVASPAWCSCNGLSWIELPERGRGHACGPTCVARSFAYIEREVSSFAAVAVRACV